MDESVFQYPTLLKRRVVLLVANNSTHRKHRSAISVYVIEDLEKPQIAFTLTQRQPYPFCNHPIEQVGNVRAGDTITRDRFIDIRPEPRSIDFSRQALSLLRSLVLQLEFVCRLFLPGVVCD